MLKEQEEPEQCNQRKHIYQKLETGQLHLKILVPYLGNPYVEDLSRNSQIKGQHETVKLPNEEIWMFQQKHCAKALIIN